MGKLLIAIVIATVAIGMWALTRKSANDEPVSTQSQQHQPQTTSVATPAVTIVYRSSGFEPSAPSVKSGETVEVSNQSNQPLDFASDPHPEHTTNSELNSGVIRPGESKRFTLTEKGSWGYHNHLSSSHTGEIRVQ